MKILSIYLSKTEKFLELSRQHLVETEEQKLVIWACGMFSKTNTKQQQEDLIAQFLVDGKYWGKWVKSNPQKTTNNWNLQAGY